MDKRYVLTLVGRDKPGIVDALTGLLAEKGCNLEDSRMAVLGGEFAGMLLVAPGPEDLLPDLVPEIERLTGMTAILRETTAYTGSGGIPFLVHGYSMDHPGIVHALAHEIATFGANIEEMETTITPAPVSGSPLFDVRMRISLPGQVSINELRRCLEQVGAERNIDVGVEPCTG